MASSSDTMAASLSSSPTTITTNLDNLLSPTTSLSLPSPVPPTIIRTGRPKLTRLDTSEMIKASDAKVKSEDQVKFKQDLMIAAGSSLDTTLMKNVKYENNSNNMRRHKQNSADGGPSQQNIPRLKLDTTSNSSSGSSGGSSSVSSTSSSWQRNSPHQESSISTFGWTPVNPSRNGIVASELIHGTSQHQMNYNSHSNPHKRRDSERLHDSGSLSAVPKSIKSPISPTRSFSLSSGAALSASFEPSEILSNFLYLGPEITTPSEVDYLRNRLGIRRIINAAYEIEDGGGKHLNLNNEKQSGFERYKKLPLKDTVEAKGVQKYIEEACAFLDDARLHSAPTYVHCKAGKSRSVMLVMAYLIHCNRWTLQRSYTYVVDRRQDVSPNIGFVAELMAFEEKRLGSSRRGNVRLSRDREGEGEDDEDIGAEFETNTNQESDTQSPNRDRRRVARESMPATPKRVFREGGPSIEQEDLVEQMASPDQVSDPTLPWLNNDNSIDSSFNLNGIGMSNEYRRDDGRYHIIRPPADEKFLAPGRRATLAAIDSENLFRNVQDLSLQDKVESSSSSSVNVSSSKGHD